MSVSKFGNTKYEIHNPELPGMKSASQKCWDECSKAIVPISVPIGIAGLGWYMYLNQRETGEWFSKLTKPSWVCTNPKIMMPLDLAAVAPIGYAAHLVCKEARGTDRQVALGLYGAGLLIWAAGIPLFMNKKDLKSWTGLMGLATGVFGATAFAFYKINNNAGLMLAPLTAWLGYQTIGMIAMMQSNPGF